MKISPFSFNIITQNLKKHMSKPATYEAAYKEIQEILEELKNDEVSIDALEGKVQRAALLAKYCSEKLRNTEKRLEQIIEDLGL